MTGSERRRGRLRRALARMREDIDVVLDKDPAAHSRLEVLLYPHLHALWLHRLAHWLYQHRRTFLARAVSMYGRRHTGVEIHPGAQIGRRFFIDHGSAVVIGETVVVGDDVMLYHQVTLGSVGWWRDRQRSAAGPRHPRIEDGVIIGTNASILGPITIGARTRIGAHAVVLKSVPPDSIVHAQAATVVIPPPDLDDLPAHTSPGGPVPR